MKALLLLLLGGVAACGAPSTPPASTEPPAARTGERPAPPLPAPPSWLERCEQNLRRAGAELIARGLQGPILTQRERWSDWGAMDYDAFIQAAATNWRLFPDPPVVDADAAPTDGLVFAIGRSMQFRVVLIPISCKPRHARAQPWFDGQKYWDPDEIGKQDHGVTAKIHTDPAPALAPLAAAFVEAMKPIVDDCLADRPVIEPAEECSPEPG